MAHSSLTTDCATDLAFMAARLYIRNTVLPAPALTTPIDSRAPRATGAKETCADVGHTTPSAVVVGFPAPVHLHGDDSHRARGRSLSCAAETSARQQPAPPSIEEMNAYRMTLHATREQVAALKARLARRDETIRRLARHHRPGSRSKHRDQQEAAVRDTVVTHLLARNANLESTVAMLRSALDDAQATADALATRTSSTPPHDYQC
ncbi:hypothetical protein SDRG_14567 [Saprolegnia diclina VS20]|uniref:Uncharacterized protein n=1 Tax=Saprolegnia diclina (strain VS20) TaxID=1156394 RepID=T0PQA1_SAPDV|nr:hypothetical protein SDRG_14567 [Saprolegnia diclina VS20]EQC27659.1 hypothetical protein SDRG_14567 [Saprolegnia diclina VS20]|eukprot:XP_008618927.1 hypothetical protein SDRG_14567 [Saprolegnia diclina VS20]